MTEYIDTETAAKYLGCSTRRIRALLSSGRMTGKKDGLTWLVLFPIQCTVGTRGPLLQLRKQGRYLREKHGIKSNTVPSLVSQEVENPS